MHFLWNVERPKRKKPIVRSIEAEFNRISKAYEIKDMRNQCSLSNPNLG